MKVDQNRALPRHFADMISVFVCGIGQLRAETGHDNMLRPWSKSRNKTVVLPELYIMQVHPLLRHSDRLLVIRAVNDSAAV
jgi:hypothetical protein